MRKKSSRLQIITVKGAPVMNATVWGREQLESTIRDMLRPGMVCRYKTGDARRWGYYVASATHAERTTSTPEMVEAFRLAGFFDPKENAH